jgi:hypothetical protein
MDARYAEGAGRLGGVGVTYGPAVTWRRIPGTAYAASSEGDIRREEPGRGAQVGRILTPWRRGGPSGQRYPAVWIHGKKRYVHELVCLAFHGPPPSARCVVHHKDEDQDNPRSDNLEWATKPENMTAWLRNGRSSAHDLEVATSERTVGDVF